VRSIPSVVDGLKPSQRKVLFSCFKRRLKEDIKVVQLGGYVAEQTAYHHGDRALYGTIVNMAQDFVGANNVPLLEASGQFGTRAVGGKDFASPRYIFTRLTKVLAIIPPTKTYHSAGSSGPIITNTKHTHPHATGQGGKTSLPRGRRRVARETGGGRAPGGA
jgi:hypothetical protein